MFETFGTYLYNWVMVHLVKFSNGALPLHSSSPMLDHGLDLLRIESREGFFFEKWVGPDLLVGQGIIFSKLFDMYL
jgi:hypothetical protein